MKWYKKQNSYIIEINENRHIIITKLQDKIFTISLWHNSFSPTPTETIPKEYQQIFNQGKWLILQKHETITAIL